jgi:hypothetical protein
LKIIEIHLSSTKNILARFNIRSKKEGDFPWLLHQARTMKILLIHPLP